ncbi:MAG: anthranilate synthase component I family protein [Actinomycetota bacterium]|nr:anthranilate synthase component I family protein [Actinomycetota bacterium]
MSSPATLLRIPLRCGLSPSDVLALLSDEPLPFALAGRWAGGGAIVGSAPIVVADDGDDPFAVLDELPAVATDTVDPTGAVGGGWFGWLGYRLAARVESIPPSPPRPVLMPEFHLAYYDNVLRRDATGRWWFEALASEARAADLERRRRRLGDLLSSAPAHHGPAHDCALAELDVSPLTLSADAAAAHLAAIVACRERIAAGEIFQANLCVRLQAAADTSAAALFGRGIRNGPPPFAATFTTPRGSIVSFSPELFLRRRAGHVMTAPIKGTAPRCADELADQAARARLLRSAKDAAEHVMIVDLMRNDLGRVSAYGSIRAAPHPTVEAHPGLWHLVTTVAGDLRPQTSNADLLRATFPPGSVTGAPKVQALTVIAELERTGREVYTGAIGYASALAGLELSVAIRTLELSGDAMWLGVGGGIVADSDPARELEEALVKGRSVATAIGTSVVTER